jgi:hypothetical protein
MAPLTGGQVIVDYLIREKVPYLFGVCAHGKVGLLDALIRTGAAHSLSGHRKAFSDYEVSVGRFVPHLTAIMAELKPHRGNRKEGQRPEMASGS